MNAFGVALVVQLAIAAGDPAAAGVVDVPTTALPSPDAPVPDVATVALAQTGAGCATTAGGLLAIYLASGVPCVGALAVVVVPALLVALPFAVAWVETSTAQLLGSQRSTLAEMAAVACSAQGLAALVTTLGVCGGVALAARASSTNDSPDAWLAVFRTEPVVIGGLVCGSCGGALCVDVAPAIWWALSDEPDATPTPTPRPVPSPSPLPPPPPWASLHASVVGGGGHDVVAMAY